MTLCRAVWGGLVLLLALPSLSCALELTPLYRAQVMGGQYFYRGDKSALTGNVSAVAAPALKFDEELALLPYIQSSYQGTKQVVDLVGAGTLFQEQMDHRLSTRLLWSPEGSRWRLKPGFSYKVEFLKETKDEKWGSGLFDYRRWCIGLEAEYLWREPFSWRFGLDYYETEFPNYTSLESEAALRFQGQSLARELVGDRVLDSQNVSLSAAVDGPVRERLVLEGSLGLSYRRFPKQRVVDPKGDLGSSLRDDVFTAAALSARMPAELNRDLRVLGSLELGYSFNASNQNDYDAVSTRYTPYFYNYGELRVAPALKLLAGPKGPAMRPVTVGLSGSWWRRAYTHRMAQDAAGLYVNGLLRTTGWTAEASLSYPMAKRWSLVFDARYGGAGSNQKFQQFYRYEYVSASYLFGVTYEY